MKFESPALITLRAVSTSRAPSVEAPLRLSPTAVVFIWNHKQSISDIKCDRSYIILIACEITSVWNDCHAMVCSSSVR